MNNTSTYNIGKQGEDLATEFLERQGYRILERNFVHNKKEIDIIAQDKNTIVFVEVKERATDVFGEPFEAVNLQKQKRIINVADNYIRKHNIDLESRFDIISIVKSPHEETKILHIKDAFTPIMF